MKRTLVLAALIFSGCAAPAHSASAQTVGEIPAGHARVTFESNDPAWVDGAPVRTRVYVGADGDTYVGVWIDAPNGQQQEFVRAPMAVSLVVDTSGSMSGEKIQNARMAAASLLETLHEGDIVSIYGFSSGVMEIAPPTQLNRSTRPVLMDRVRRLTSGGGTNMHDGMTMGISRISEAPASHPVRRVILISDGHANIGPSDPETLGNLAARGTEYGMQVTAIGVGLDYDETTLGTLAVRSSGRMYHLQHSHQMATILRDEVQLLAQTVATGAYIEVVPAAGVVITEGITMGSQLRNGRLRIPLGTIHAGQRREMLFRARVDTSRAGSRDLATTRLVYTSDNRERVQERPLRYEVTRNRRAAERSETPRVVAMVSNHEATQAELRAAAALNRGDQVAAQRQYDFAADALDRGAAAAPAAPTSGALRRRATRVRAARTRASSAMSARQMRSEALNTWDDAMSAEGF